MGTKFTIYLPAAKGLAEKGLPARTPLTPASSLERGSETILLVEDEEPVRNITRQLLETLGYRVIEAENGQAAVRLFSVWGEKINLLFTDVIMPELSGRELAETLLAQKPSLPVLFQSGYTGRYHRPAGRFTEEVAFLKKPFTLDILGQKVREVLNRSDGHFSLEK